MKALRVIAFIVASILLGDVVARYLANLNVDTPNLNRATQWVIALFSPSSASNPDVVFDVGTIFLAVCSTIAAGAVIYLAWHVIQHWRKSSA